MPGPPAQGDLWRARELGSERRQPHFYPKSVRLVFVLQYSAELGLGRGFSAEVLAQHEFHPQHWGQGDRWAECPFQGTRSQAEMRPVRTDMSSTRPRVPQLTLAGDL